MSGAPLAIGLVGPLPPPSGGMANQTRQLARLLEEEGVRVEIVQTNAPYRPAWAGSLRGVRALFRLVPYLARLWSAAGRVRMFHVMANSGWSWHLCAAPAVWIGKLRRIPVVVNYRGGGAEQFLERSARWVRPTVRLADRLVVPSGFLERVFGRFGLAADIVPNVIDLGRFSPAPSGGAPRAGGPHVIVTRNLEPLYDIGTALRAFARVQKSRPVARMTVAGSGPEHERLAALAQSLGVADLVTFTGRLDNERIAALYRDADIFVNPSLVDNMPISVLEALASGVPVVSTNVGGVSYVVEHDRTALLVEAGDSEAMAREVLSLLDDPKLAARLVRAGLVRAQEFGWSEIRDRWFAVYDALTRAAERLRHTTGASR